MNNQVQEMQNQGKDILTLSAELPMGNLLGFPGCLLLGLPGSLLCLSPQRLPQAEVDWERLHSGSSVRQEIPFSEKPG